jgi:hypothetical protein
MRVHRRADRSVRSGRQVGVSHGVGFHPEVRARYDRGAGGGTMRALTVCAVALVVSVNVPAQAALDCARVRALNQEGKRASDIAHELGITTPDVQSCLAGEAEDVAPTRAKTGLPLMPQLPAGDAAVPRAPNQ